MPSADRATGVPDPGRVREVALQAAREAGEIQRRSYGRVENLRLKGEVDLVTEVDERCEMAISDVIRVAFPDHRILAEEGSVGGQDSRHRWIVDPLDGTTNFAHGLPFFCTSIAYECDGQVLAGVIYDALRDELFLAERGRGATLNGRPLTVSQTDVLLHSLTTTGFPYDRSRLPRALAFFSALSAQARAVRRLGSAALDLAYVAAGRFEAYWEAVVYPWDVAAGWLIVEEAGGRVTDLRGESFGVDRGEILATNSVLHAAMIAALQAADPAARSNPIS